MLITIYLTNNTDVQTEDQQFLRDIKDADIFVKTKNTASIDVIINKHNISYIEITN